MTSDVSRVSEEIEVELTYLSFLGLSPAAALSVFTAGMLISLQSYKIRHINSDGHETNIKLFLGCLLTLTGQTAPQNNKKME